MISFNTEYEDKNIRRLKVYEFGAQVFAITFFTLGFVMEMLDYGLGMKFMLTGIMSILVSLSFGLMITRSEINKKR